MTHIHQAGFMSHQYDFTGLELILNPQDVLFKDLKSAHVAPLKKLSNSRWQPRWLPKI